MQELEINIDSLGGGDSYDGAREFAVECECSIPKKGKLLDRLKKSGAINPLIQDKSTHAMSCIAVQLAI